jgi:hypothetical protein
MAEELDSLMSAYKSLVSAVRNGANILIGITTQIKEEAETARELAEKVKDDDPNAAKVAVKAFDKVLKAQELLRDQVRDLESDIQDIKKTRVAIGKAADKAGKK